MFKTLDESIQWTKPISNLTSVGMAPVSRLESKNASVNSESIPIWRSSETTSMKKDDDDNEKFDTI